MSVSANEDQVVLNILLNCQHTKLSETKQLHFKALPTTPLEIKKKIEEDFSIPSCVQTLHHQSMILKDSDQLQHTHFRSGDTFTIDYPIEAECETVQSVIKWLKELFESLKSVEKCISSPGEWNNDHFKLLSTNCRKIDDLIAEGKRDNTINTLCVTLFGTWGDKKELVTRVYFQQEGGLDLLMEVYGILVIKEWGHLGIKKAIHIYLENMCCRAIWNYSEAFSHRRQIVKMGGMEMFIKTLLKRRLRVDKGIPDAYTYNALYSALCALAT